MNFKTIAFALLSCVLATSCIQDEALNCEAAIDGIKSEDIQLSYIDVDRKTIDLYVSPISDFNNIHLEFTLPDGARCFAKTQDPKDNPPFSYNFNNAEKKRVFTVVSEDEKYAADYELLATVAEIPDKWHFETLLDPSASYHTFLESEILLCSGNPGFNLTGMAGQPADYPTVQERSDLPNSNSRYCVKLETKNTGSFGAMVNMHIAAGNLFIGSFDLGNALSNAKESTLFGFPYFHKPVRIKGYYKYKAGPVFSVGGVNVDGRRDECDIYAMLYESDGEFLNGGNGLTSERIVLLAHDEKQFAETDEWKHFDLEFKPVNNKSFDAEKMRQGKYKLGVVFSSSKWGADFQGAIGSTLLIDEVELVKE